MGGKKFRYLLAFGSNLGPRERHLETGLRKLLNWGRIIWKSREIDTSPLSSSFYNTAEHAPYLNFVADFETSCKPEQLYHNIVEIEDLIGHSREQKWLPRQLDIDLLFWAKNEHPIFTSCTQLSYLAPSGPLQIPHYDFWNRDFLISLIQECPELELSVLRSASRMRCQDV